MGLAPAQHGEVDDMARRRRRRCGFACCTLVIAVVALLIAFPTVWRTARPLVHVAAYPVGAVCIVLVTAALVADVSARCCRRRRAGDHEARL